MMPVVKILTVFAIISAASIVVCVEHPTKLYLPVCNTTVELNVTSDGHNVYLKGLTRMTENDTTVGTTTQLPTTVGTTTQLPTTVGTTTQLPTTVGTTTLTASPTDDDVGTTQFFTQQVTSATQPILITETPTLESTTPAPEPIITGGPIEVDPEMGTGTSTCSRITVHVTEKIELFTDEQLYLRLNWRFPGGTSVNWTKDGTELDTTEIDNIMDPRIKLDTVHRMLFSSSIYIHSPSVSKSGFYIAVVYSNSSNVAEVFTFDVIVRYKFKVVLERPERHEVSCHVIGPVKDNVTVRVQTWSDGVLNGTTLPDGLNGTSMFSFPVDPSEQNVKCVALTKYWASVSRETERTVYSNTIFPMVTVWEAITITLTVVAITIGLASTVWMVCGIVYLIIEFKRKRWLPDDATSEVIVNEFGGEFNHINLVHKPPVGCVMGSDNVTITCL